MADVKHYGFGDEVNPEDAERKSVVIPAGRAFFSVLKVAKVRKPFGKFGTCNIAVVTLMCTTEEGTGQAEIECNLPLVDTLLWKYLGFFAAIGQRKSGDKGLFKPDWTKVEGSDGICEIEVRPVERKDKTTYEVNDVKAFIPADAPAEDNLAFN